MLAPNMRNDTVHACVTVHARASVVVHPHTRVAQISGKGHNKNMKTC